ncbi:MAG: hypothetical protein R3B89_28560 [Polyangiaceae bacterium]
MKPSTRRQSLICLGLLGFLPVVTGVGAGVFGCGYSTVLGRVEGGLALAAEASLVPEPLLLRAALRGARERLRQLDAFAVSSPAVLSIEILRLDERGAAALAVSGQPQGRSEELVVRARGRVVEAGAVVLERELSRRALLAAAPGLELDRDGALLRLGHRVGSELASAALGLPTPGEV